MFEIQGVEASAEVQVAARKVADENKKLRELLMDQGFTDDYISRYLQRPDRPPQTAPSAQVDPSAAVQSLHQVIAPRRLAGLENNSPYMLPSQIMPSTSPGSVATIQTSASWESLSGDASSSYSQQQPDSQMEGSSLNTTDNGIYSAGLFTANSMQSGAGAYTTQPPAAYTTQQLHRVYANPNPSMHTNAHTNATYNDSPEIYSQHPSGTFSHPPGYL